MSHVKTNPVIPAILAAHPVKSSFTEAATKYLNYTAAAAYSARKRGVFPVRVRAEGEKLVVFTADLIAYIESGESQAELSAPQLKTKYHRTARQYEVKTGRPTKRESLEAAKLGVSVKELRAMAGKPVKTAAAGG